MFVAWRELRFARGRFVLIGSVVALITLLVGFLSGLTAGLASQNVSGVLSLPADRIVFSASATESATGASFSDSTIAQEQATEWGRRSGVDAAHPIGISQTRAEAGNARTAIALFGVDSGFDSGAPSADGRLGLSDSAAADLDVNIGDTVTIAGIEFVVSTIDGDWWYSHTPVVQMTLHDWQRYSAATGSPDAYATVLAITGNPDWAGTDTAVGTVSKWGLTSNGTVVGAKG
ncbi:MAG: hypothetical protein ABIX44_07455 [Cryobacterium sp.]